MRKFSAILSLSALVLISGLPPIALADDEPPLRGEIGKPSGLRPSEIERTDIPQEQAELRGALQGLSSDAGKSSGLSAAGDVDPPLPQATAARLASPDQKEKDALISQIIQTLQPKPLTEAQKEYNKQLMKQRFEHMADVIADKAGMSAAERSKLKERINRPRPHASHPKLSALCESMQCKQFAHDTVYKILEEHFTKRDLRDILRFLQSTTGQKLIASAPDMVFDAFQDSVEYFVPKFIEMGRQRRRLMHLQDKQITPEQEQMIEQMQKLFREKSRRNLPTDDGADD